LVENGTYTGNGNRDIDYNGKSIVVKSENGAEVTIINAEGNPDNYGPRGFVFHSGEDSLAILDGFTIKKMDMVGVMVMEEAFASLILPRP
jgi:hypothetical protein